MDCGRAERRLLQGKALGKVAQLVRDAAPFSLVGPPDAAQPGKPETPISAHPSLQCTQGKLDLLGHARLLAVTDPREPLTISRSYDR